MTAPLTLVKWAPNVSPLERRELYRAAGLPAYASTFVGRRRALADLAGLLAKSRLVSLTGPPGSGKTRLAVEAARRSSRSRTEGSVLVELAPLSEAALLPEAVAGALGVRTIGARTARDALLQRLALSDLLLVVDNCEHLVEACAGLVDLLLRRCPSLAVIATSREPLRIDGEVVWPVPPLDLPADGASISVAARSEAVQLFVERAHQSSPGFHLTQSNAAQVASICRRLDGLPLALEIAAGRAGVVDLQTIGEQLRDRFRFLTSGFRTAPPRHRTLRAAIDWSYELLTVAEQQILSRSAVFAGSFDVAAASGVCTGGAVTQERVVDLLASLADKSLIVPMSSTAGVRYRLLESVREYGLDRLRDSGEIDVVRRRHARHYDAMPGDYLSDVTWVPRMQVETENVREALAWARDADPELCLSLAVKFGQYCMTAGSVGEGRSWLASAMDTRVHNPDLLASGNAFAAYLAWRMDDSTVAQTFAAAAVQFSRQGRDYASMARSLEVLAFVSVVADPAVSERSVDEMLRLASEAGDRRIESAAVNLRGLAASIDGRLDEACDLLARGIALAHAIGAELQAATPYNVLGWNLLQLGRIAEARSAVSSAIRIRDRYHLAADMAGSLDTAAELAFREGSPEKAMRLKGASDRMRETIGSQPPSMAVDSRARWTSLAEASLGKAADKAYAEGRRLSPQEAVAYALASPSAAPPRGGRVEGKLSAREHEISQLVAGGLSNDEIATRLKLSRRTVEAHLDHIRTKLGARSRVEVATWVAARSTPQPTSRS